MFGNAGDNEFLVACQDTAVIVFDGERITSVDEKALRAEAREIFTERQGALAGARHEADRWLPYYEKMVSMAAARDVGMNRWLGYAYP